MREVIIHILVAVFTVLLGTVLFTISETYGWIVFVFCPMLAGYALIYTLAQKRHISVFYGLGQVCVSFLVCAVMLLSFALEGAICILMASPLLIFLMFLGGMFAKVMTEKGGSNKVMLFIGVLFGIASFSFDVLYDEPTLIPVTTTVMIDAPIEEVWHNVITFDKIAEPTELLFKTGISYPIDARIEGSGVGAVRHCNFTTGSFVEPITEWTVPTSLKFSVLEQPTPMKETNPFWDIQPKHLNNYFLSEKGQFDLKSIDAKTTELSGTTFYKVNVRPEWYWKTWSDYIIHEIHLRVLNHIKQESESKS